MGQSTGTISKTDDLTYCWKLGTRSPASVLRSPDFVDFPFSNAIFLRFNHGTLSLCHHTMAASLSFDASILLKYATKTENFKLNNVRKCKQYWDEDTDEYILKTIDIKSLESICCTFTNVRGICETALEKGEQETKTNCHHATEKKGEMKEAKGEQETKVEYRAAETKRRTREASVQCAISEYFETRGEQKIKGRYHSIEKKGENREASTQCEISELTGTRGLVSLGTDLRKLFVREEDSDVAIQVGDQKYPVHKFILRARSPVFQAMLKHDMTETTRRVVDIPDCDPHIFQDFLLYLYAGKLDNISEENVFELYRISDKYDVQELKLDCVDFMLSNMAVGVICDVISLAAKHSEAQLLLRATEFFVENARDILPTVNWQTFVQGNPLEANELFIKAFRNFPVNNGYPL